ncbi:MAG: endonuclease/exonuclease/phosphatase family protein [Candidatus Micrarchaeia archaeon]
MKLISLNLWDGRVYDKLFKFLKAKMNDTDIFCFQEVLDSGTAINEEAAITKHLYHGTELKEVQDLYSRLVGTLTGFQGFLSRSYSDGSERLATFVRKGITADVGIAQVHKRISVLYEGKYFGVESIMQHVKIYYEGKEYFIANVHGLWQGGGKLDTPERIEQSRNILKVMSHFGERRILCGDLNLDISTESVRMLEYDMRNLVKEFKVKSTRSKLASQRKGRFADYIFTSPAIKINKFKVMKNVVSDHLPLYIDFE